MKNKESSRKLEIEKHAESLLTNEEVDKILKELNKIMLSELKNRKDHL